VDLGILEIIENCEVDIIIMMYPVAKKFEIGNSINGVVIHKEGSG